jgi:phosphohistidine phosphatase SixA
MTQFLDFGRSTLILALLLGSVLSAPLMANETVIYLVRHAEKDVSQKQDPPLTTSGQQRAQRWATVFQHVPVSAVYSTDTRRTRDTAAPLAKAKNLAIKLYEPGSLDAEQMLELHGGSTVFIVGHSNTVPGMVNKFAGEMLFQDLDESEYNDLFRVSLPADRGPVQVERLQLPLSIR